MVQRSRRLNGFNHFGIKPYQRDLAEFRQTLRGTYHRLDAPGEEHPLAVTVRAQVHAVSQLVLHPKADLSGEIDAEGLADHKPVRGSLEVRPLARLLVYELHFPDNNGRELRLHGRAEVELEIDPGRMIETMTTVPGSIYDGEEEIGRALLRFSPRTELLKLLRSFKTT